jgi:hypothetical protein
MNIKGVCYIAAVLLFSVQVSGCASIKESVTDFFGFSISDLEKARETGLTRTYPLPYDTAFDKAVEAAKAAKVTVYKADRARGVITLMDIPKQVDTTFVGVFLEAVDASNTKITISSLSSLALQKAGMIIFGGMDGNAPSLAQVAGTH